MNSKKLHILFLCGWYPSRVLTNNGDFIQRHAEAVKLLHDVSVIHIISDQNCTKSIETISETINAIPTHIAYIKPSKNPLIKGIRFFRAFKLLLKKIGKFDIVHLNELFPFGLFALYIKWYKHKHYIISEHWTDYHQPLAQQISKLEITLSRLISKNASYICPVTQNLANSMLKLGLKGEYITVPNVVNNEFFVPIINKTNDLYTIVHISNMYDPHKNVSGILHTIKKLSEHILDFKLILIGENSIQYKKLSEELNINNFIDFIDHIPHQQIIKHIQNADVLVLFSNYENLPCIILESFSCGTPVISTNVGGISEFFPEQFGVLIEKKNEDQLLKHLIELKSKTHKNETVKQMNSYVADHFSPMSIAKQFSKIYYKSIV